jgi:hypothetical protein
MKRTSLAAILILLLAGTAAAFTVDFRDAAFSGANYKTSFTTGVDGLAVTLKAGPYGARLYQDSIDGLGIRYSYDKDEIEGSERLRILFSAPVFLSSALITDIFNEGYLERGYYQLNGAGSWVGFHADPSQTWRTNGELELLFDSSILVNSIAFKAPGWLPFKHQAHEFSVAAIEVNAVPIPAAAWLLGAGLAGLVALRRKRQTS